MPHLAISFFFRRNKYKIAKVRYFPGEKLYKGILQFFPKKKLPTRSHFVTTFGESQGF